ncbi:MAG: hypothetical protein QOI73_675 [Solirubrobacteraceae bacterium]|nr:hypothetical protein [Solirubrobacteraceae bacterium]
MRGLALLVATGLAALAGVGAASLLTGAPAAGRIPVVRDELTALTDELGALAPDHDGGPPWAVRVLDRDGPLRCIAAVRVQDGAVGPVADGRHVVATPAVHTGSCADPAAEPLQVALARFAATATTGPRSVLLAIADASVATVRVLGPDGLAPVALDASRTFVVVHDGLAAEGAWTVTVTLRDGGLRSYRL